MKRKIQNILFLLDQIEQEFTGLTHADIDLPSQEFLHRAAVMRIKLERLLEGLK